MAGRAPARAPRLVRGPLGAAGPRAPPAARRVPPELRPAPRPPAAGGARPVAPPSSPRPGGAPLRPGCQRPPALPLWARRGPAPASGLCSREERGRPGEASARSSSRGGQMHAQLPRYEASLSTSLPASVGFSCPAWCCCVPSAASPAPQVTQAFTLSAGAPAGVSEHLWTPSSSTARPVCSAFPHALGWSHSSLSDNSA